jgi:hypothetical protein
MKVLRPEWRPGRTADSVKDVGALPGAVKTGFLNASVSCVVKWMKNKAQIFYGEKTIIFQTYSGDEN